MEYSVVNISDDKLPEGIMEDPKQIKDDGNSLSQYAMVKLSEPTVKIENNEKLTNRD